MNSQLHRVPKMGFGLSDRAVVITGSFKFTKAAEEKNAENLLIVHSKELAKPYLENWQRHREHSAA